MTSDHEHFMREAIALSAQNMEDNTGGPFGAVIVKDGKIVGRGSNKVTSSNDPTAHAEVVAIRDACKNLDDFSLAGCEIYTSCEPCPMCLSAIYWSRLDKIYFANTQHDAAEIDFDDRFLYEQVALPKEERSLPSVPLLRDEALKVFKEWQQKTDKIPY
ncbi:MAG: nucleoside deaminase [Pseudomonadota bacterium]|jgi:tRNA(Arg) A34 adenosine deaminase TadA|nr:nucleoside deaminase [Pseudomonadota bacterium]QKK04299.1 MAG: nucleoside deaminase [Pseudomonadota bacterium]|tara:strand:- start:78 stop:554 length:477 start_codon:yes stop_codon:yes gene_type:complete